MSQPTLQAVEKLAMQLTAEEQLMLLERLASNRRHTAHASGPKDLRGVWRGCIEDEFDLDAALNEIRTEWLRELDE